ncbi:PREDICTED: mucin-1 [Thamnophis sirtalis]|uniref:Mucin-1 n=1 Tax=Thamnophis sirtalis TaxID=35019 RepID=A0A6I9YRX4_9SAUR|nr:PREDICTED: mucin-1 [Thamnophis sirtalis]
MKYHITNKDFNSSLLNPNSPYYRELNQTIGTMYNNVYKCKTCEYGYKNFEILSFSPGSVAVASKLFFEGTKAPTSESQVAKILNEAKDLAGLELTGVEVRTDPFPPPSEGVPGWAIALLVLVSILVFFLILGLLWLLVYYIRRKRRGNMDVLSSRDLYHPMNEYPTYQTHGRFAPPGNKQNPYEEGNRQPQNPTKGFSYTNPAMANDQL